MAKARLYFDGDNTYIEKQARIYKMVDEIGDKIDNIPGVINNLSSTSETDALSAAMGKELQDQINALSGNFHFLSSWDCTTGLPGSDPATDPYVYQSGDYYIVSNTGSTNYKPHGSSYTHGVASTAVETQAVQMNDWYVYDGSTWILQPSGGQTIVIDTALSTTSTNPVENRVITQALNNKQNTIANLSAIESGAAAGATAVQPGANISVFTNNAGYQTAGDVASAISGKQDVLTAGEGISINNNIITNTGITCLEGGADIEVVQGGTHGIPTGYTELEHISLFGSQYISTGLSYASGHTYSIHQRILFETSTNNNRGSGWNAGGAVYITGTTMGDGSLNSNLGPTGGIADIFIEIGNGTSDYTTVVGGVTRISSRANTALSDYAGINYPLGVMSGTGGGLQSGSNMIGSVYFFEYTDGNDRGEYYPVQRDSDDALGMYDVVGGTFYPVIGTGAVAGPEAADCTTVNFTNASGYMLKSSNKLIYATTDTAYSTRDKVCTTAAGNYTPREGDVLALTFNSGCGVGGPRLNIDGSGLHEIRISTTTTNAVNFWLGMQKISWLFIYDGNYWITRPVKDTLYTAGTGLSLSSGTFSNTQPGPTVGTTAPASPTEGDMWYDTTNHVLKVYNGSQWVEVGSGGGGGSTTWGNIGGILSNQTDLQDALDDKLESTDLVAGNGINIQAVGSALPSGYTQLAYIQLNGTQALRTNITGVGSTIEIDLQCSSTAANVQEICAWDEDYLGTFFGIYGDAFAVQNSTAGKISGVNVMNRNTISGAFSRNTYPQVSLTAGGDTVSYTRTSNRNDNYLCVGGAISTLNQVLNGFSGYIFSVKIYNTSTSELIANYIPCRDDNSLNVGLYDTVSGTFNTATVGTFAAGPVVPVEGLEISVDDSVFTTDSVTGGTDIEIVTQAGRGLPAGYTEIEYLQSSGTQWINTGITGNVSSTRTLKSDVGVRYDTVPTADTCLLGSRDGNVRAYMVYCYMGWCLGYGAQYRRAGNIAAETKYFVTTEYKESSQTFDVNGLRVMSYTDNMPFTTDLNMYLFAINEGGVAKRFQSAKVYYAKIYVNDVLEFDGVPAKRNSDNALGIYDMVTETFLTNQGSGTFTAGPVVQPGTVINFTNDSGYVTAADIPTYTAGAGIDITSNVISSTVLGFNNLTYDSFTTGTWTANATVSFPATAKMAFLNWRAKSSATGTPPFACGQVLIVRGLTLVSSFVGGGDGTDYIYGGVGLDSASTYIDYTQADKTAGAAGIDYTIYFYK